VKIAVIDGQGGGIGRLIIEKLRNEFGQDINIMALGTNAVATSVMLKAGANDGASGENAVVQGAYKADIILGSVAIIAANAYYGELTTPMAEAVSTSPAHKLLIPMNRCGIEISSSQDEPLPIQVDQLISRVRFHKCLMSSSGH
jgi:hypothetical protein